MSGEQEVVRAAGGVVRRGGPNGEEVLLVHRPRYDDWTFPKGKAEPDETDEAAALREVEEETGFRCALGQELPSTRYRDARGRPKVVRYWTMRIESGHFKPHDEVDAIRWERLRDAAESMSYDRDQEVLELHLWEGLELGVTLGCAEERRGQVHAPAASTMASTIGE